MRVATVGSYFTFHSKCYCIEKTVNVRDVSFNFSIRVEPLYWTDRAAPKDTSEKRWTMLSVLRTYHGDRTSFGFPAGIPLLCPFDNELVETVSEVIITIVEMRTQ